MCMSKLNIGWHSQEISVFLCQNFVRIFMWSSSVEPKSCQPKIVKHLRLLYSGCRTNWLCCLPFNLLLACYFLPHVCNYLGCSTQQELWIMYDFRHSMVFFPHSASGCMHRKYRKSIPVWLLCPNINGLTWHSRGALHCDEFLTQ